MRTLIRNAIVGMLLITLTGTVVAQQERTFSRPTDEQIEAAANNPELLAELLEGATPEQAAEVVVRVIVQINSLNISAEAKEARINNTVQAALAATPSTNQTAFAQALGRAVAADPVLSISPLVTNTVSTSLSTVGGLPTTLGETFGSTLIKTIADQRTGTGYAGQEI